MSFDFLAQTGATLKLTNIEWLSAVTKLPILMRTTVKGKHSCFNEPDSDITRLYIELLDEVGDDIGQLAINGGYRLSPTAAHHVGILLGALAFVEEERGAAHCGTYPTELRRYVDPLPAYIDVIDDEMRQMGSEWSPEVTSADSGDLGHFRRILVGIAVETLREVSEFFKESNGVVIA